MINGPVVLVPVGQQNRFVDCEVPWTQTDYIGSPKQFWGVPPRAGQYQLVFLVDCTFRRCRFDHRPSTFVPAASARSPTAVEYAEMGSRDGKPR